MTTLYLTITYLASVAIASYYFIKMGSETPEMPRKLYAAFCILPIVNSFYAICFIAIQAYWGLRQLSAWLDYRIDLWAIRRYNSYKGKQTLR